VAVVALAAAYLAATSARLPDVLYLADFVWIYPFVVLGYVVGSLKPTLLQHRRTILVVSLAVFVPLFYLRYPIYVPELQPLAVSSSKIGVVGAYAIEKALAYLCSTAAVLALFMLYVGREGRSISAQAWVGRRSLGVYATHAVILAALLAAGVTNPLVLFVLALAAALVLTEFIGRVPLLDSLLLGRMKSPRTTLSDRRDDVIPDSRAA